MITSLIGRMSRVVIQTCPVPDEAETPTTIGDESTHERTEAVWRRAVALYRTGMHPGIQLCIRHGGDVVLNRSIGYASGVRPGRPIDPATAIPMSVDTPVNLFSAAKAVTAMTMHKLAEQGWVDLDEPVATYIPGFERHDKGTITIRQVLTHRAGIPSMPTESFDLDLLLDPERVSEMICDLTPRSSPGGPPAYHAVTGGFILEAITRGATGRSLREHLRADVKEPLGLGRFDYGVRPDEVGLVAPNIITGLPLTPPLEMHLRRLLGRNWAEVVKLSNDPRFLAGVIPSANVIATASDTAAFYQCLLSGGVLDGTRVFEEETVARAVADHTGGGAAIDRMIGLPFRYGDGGFMHGTGNFSIYGWSHPKAFGHVGMSNSFTWADPDRDLVVALLTTGKPILGSHVIALPQLISEIHHSFPASTPTER